MGAKPVIVVAAYRRLHSLQRLLRSIEGAIYTLDDITLIISIDYHPDNTDVIQCAEEFKWTHGNKIVRTHKENIGLKRHIIECGDYSMEYGAAIILEDDVLVAPAFYEYARHAHDYYAADERIAGISLYGHEWNHYAAKKFQPVRKNGDVYFGQFSCTWGESWSAKQWSAFKDWYANNPEIKRDELLPASIYEWTRSWGKYFVRYLAETNRYYILPYKPVSTVFGEVGTHSSEMELDVQVSLYWGNEEYHFVPFEEGQHYDIFFECIDLKAVLAERNNIKESDICIDLYALPKRKYGNKRYVLTTRMMQYQIMECYDFNLRPHEVNVLLDMHGNGIFLYDTSTKKKNKKRQTGKRIEYDFAGVRGPEALIYGWCHCWKVLFKCLRILDR